MMEQKTNSEIDMMKMNTLITLEQLSLKHQWWKSAGFLIFLFGFITMILIIIAYLDSYRSEPIFLMFYLIFSLPFELFGFFIYRHSKKIKLIYQTLIEKVDYSSILDDKPEELKNETS